MAIPKIFNRKNKKIDNIETGLIDPVLLQKLQDNFCRANGMYLSCIGEQEGVITKAFGEKRELEYIHELANKDSYMMLLRKMQESSLERMKEEPLPYDFLKMCGMRYRIGESAHIIWIVIAVLEEKIPADVEIPEYILKTTEERFYRSIEFLEVLTKLLLGAKMSELIAQEAMLKSEDNRKSVETQLFRSKAMTEIVKQLESDSAFSKIVEDCLRETCKTLKISGGCLIRDNVENNTVDMLCEYVADEQFSHIAEFQEIEKESFPFFTERAYMISSDSIRPPRIEAFFEQNHISAAIIYPIEINNKIVMYVCFYEFERERLWEEEDIKFINDVRRIIQGILSKRIAKNSLASSYSALEAILENVGTGIYVADEQKRQVLYTNQRFREIFSNSIKESKVEDIVFRENKLLPGQSIEEFYVETEKKWIDVNKTQIDWVDGRKVSLLTIYDITDKKLYQQKIEMQANNDFLTGLYNRMRCEQDLERAIHKAEMLGQIGALIYVDIDDFKYINDGLGHQYGDILLQAIAQSFLKIDGIDKNCYRMGGDEFIVVVEDTTQEEIHRICHEIKEIFSNPWFLKGEDYYCTVSIGVSMFPEDGNSVDDVIRKADMALFSAKKKGKNQVEIFSEQDDASSSWRLDLEKNMRSATMNECKEFEVYYQPIIDVTKKDCPCVGAEALVRWNSVSLGFINPGDFIPLAEYLGLINPIGEHVLESAAKRCKYWNDMGHTDFKVNVNLSVVQLLQNDIVKKIKDVLTSTRINPKNLRLEVTESLAINDMERMRQILGEIKELGITVALDDFGTGYSSLNHIRELPIDVIKIDRCFVENIAEDEFSVAFVKMVAELAKTIGMIVCVEGVETQAQYEILQGLGIQLIQGYYFGKPMRMQDFEKAYIVE